MSFLVGLLPYVGSLATTVGAEVAGFTASTTLGSAATAATTAGIGAVADAALSKVVDTDALKKEAYKQLSFAQKIALLRKSGNIDTKEIIRTIKGSETLKGTSLDTIKDRSKLFVNEVSSELLKGELIGKAVENVSDDSPLFNWLGLSILSKSDNDAIIPTDAEYLYVSSVYDGSVFFNDVTKERFTNGNREFYTNTEKGEVSWFFPEYNNYQVIPPIWGTWTGMNSPNNALPMSVMIDGVMHMSLLDRIAHVHDVLYRSYGVFSKFSDYVLISYISKGLEQNLFILPGERSKALLAINYFSSLGKVMRSLYSGSNSIYDLGVGDNKDNNASNDTIIDDNIEEVTNIPEVPILVELSNDLELGNGTELITADAIIEVKNNIGSGPIDELLTLINNLTFESD